MSCKNAFYAILCEIYQRHLKVRYSSEKDFDYNNMILYLGNENIICIEIQ